jgi:hypothetical protein
MWTQDFRQSTEFGGVFRRWDETEPGIFILRVFSKALQEVIRWANELADQGKRCDAAAFEAFRRQALESDR